MNSITVRMKSYIQPFERHLALLELRALSGGEPVQIMEGKNFTYDFSVTSSCSVDQLARRLTYWETVKSLDNMRTTTQSLRESTVNLIRNGVALDELKRNLPFEGSVPLPNRRCLRYGTHGIHEYRGKFFPQLVRSLINISGVRAGETVADPMSGSGTTIVEAALAGCKGLGIDMNPLSVLLGNAKCSLLSADTDKLEAGYLEIRKSLSSIEVRAKNNFEYLNGLPAVDQDYLSSWFSADVLQGLDDITCAINRVSDLDARALARIALSNIVRKVSWQKVDDLRVRKEIRLDIEIDPKKEFLEELARSVRAVLAFLYQNGSLSRGKFDIREGDARNCGSTWVANSVDVVITSPPYATALPYLDTDRLSLIFLGLLPRPHHRLRDQLMIGNREVSNGQRRAYWEKYQSDSRLLPDSIRMLINTVDTLNSGTSAGFRRLNLPSLLSKYFFDMREVMIGIKRALKPGSSAFVVVGNNHTVAGGRRIEIQTASLLKDIARDIGFDVAPSLSMDMLLSRDIFKTNAMASEEILAFRKPQK
jgi:DNA modification methylase